MKQCDLWKLFAQSWELSHLWLLCWLTTKLTIIKIVEDWILTVFSFFIVKLGSIFECPLRDTLVDGGIVALRDKIVKIEHWLDIE